MPFADGLRIVPGPKGFPKSVVIADHRWKVLYSPDLIGSKEALGVTLRLEQTVILDTSLSPEKMRHVLAHELVHAMFSNQPDVAGVDHECEERIVQTIAPALLSLLRSNPKWWD